VQDLIWQEITFAVNYTKDDPEYVVIVSDHPRFKEQVELNGYGNVQPVI
jgi:hypothetical protein